MNDTRIFEPKATRYVNKPKVSRLFKFKEVTEGFQFMDGEDFQFMDGGNFEFVEG